MKPRSGSKYTAVGSRKLGERMLMSSKDKKRTSWEDEQLTKTK